MVLAYRACAYFGLFSIFGALLYGFRYDPAGRWQNYLYDVCLYLAFIAVHLVMTRGWFKQALYGSPRGSLSERRVFIGTTVVTWLGVLALQRPLPGASLAVAEPLRFAATVGVLWSLAAFFEGATFAMLDGLLGVHGSALALSHGAETPLFSEGQYAQVRHPQYRAVLLAGACSLLVHPNAAQLLWCLLIGGTFVAFIPIEEAQLVAGRGDAYTAYMRRTPWRLMRGVW